MHWRRWRYVFPLRLRSLFCPSVLEDELDEELRFHLQCRIEEDVARGIDAAEARYRALRALGSLQLRKEEMRDMRGLNWFSDLAGDVKHGLRTIGHAKLVTAVIVITLGLGIGANSAIFSLADAVLLRPLPVLRPSEIVTLSTLSPSSASSSIGVLSYRDYVDYRDKSTSFEGLAAYSFAMNFGFAKRAGELPALTGGLLVSGNLFRVMQVRPELGRDFSPGEDRVPGRDPVIILSHSFWQSEFNGDRSVIGRRILLDGIQFSIIGVAPESFTGLDQYTRPELYVPLMMWPALANANQKPLEDRADRELIVKGRFRPGVSLSAGRAEVRAIAQNLQREYPKTNAKENATIRTELALRLQTDPSDAALVLVLLGLAGAVLLIACANVSGLLLGRARMRSREIAVRLAIGAGRFRLVRLLFTENVLMAAIAGGVGIALAYGGVRFFARYQIPNDLPMRLSVQLDRRVFLLSLAVSLMSAILCGLAPALQSARTNLVPALKAANADIPRRTMLWGRNTLVICQIAASLALLIAALQMVRTFQEKWRGGAGFRTDHLLTMAFDPQLVRSSEAKTQWFYKELVRRTRLLLGVKSAALTGELPMSNDGDSISVVPEGYQMPKDRDHFAVDMDVAGESYFDTLGVRLIRGRAFRETDTATSPKVAIVNEQFAKQYWPNSDPLGKRFRIDSANGPLVQIVGITKTAKYEWIGEPPTQFVYLPFTQHPRSKMTLLIQTQGPSAALIGPMRELVRGLDPGQPVFGVRSIEDFYHKRVIMAPVMVMQAVTTMGLIGLALTLAGVYGLMSYATSRRTREIGIRMAIGADANGVLRMILRQALLLLLGGIATGLILAAFAERGLHAIFETSQTDLGAYVFVLPSLLAITLLAAFIPARKASRIEPTRALRYE